MTWNDIRAAAKALIEYQGSDSRMNALEASTKSRVLNAYTWEQFQDTIDLAYTASSESIDLATNDYRHIHRIVALRVEDANYAPPDWVPPNEYNRLVAANWDTQVVVQYFTQIGRKLYLLGRPASDHTLNTTFMRSANNVGWSEIPDDFLDFSALVLARKLTPASIVDAVGTVGANPVRVVLYAEEKGALRDLITLELRRPARSYQGQEDPITVIRREEYEEW